MIGCILGKKLGFVLGCRLGIKLGSILGVVDGSAVGSGRKCEFVDVSTLARLRTVAIILRGKRKERE